MIKTLFHTYDANTDSMNCTNYNKTKLHVSDLDDIHFESYANKCLHKTMSLMMNLAVG